MGPPAAEFRSAVALFHLLANKKYLGLTTHKGKTYEGQHEAIVDAELFEAVQARLAERSNPTTSAEAKRRVSLLAGMIRDEHGRPMSPFHTTRHGRRYSYYASHPGDRSRLQALRLPAGELDAAVRGALSDLLSNSAALHGQYTQLEPHQLFALLGQCAGLAERIRLMSVAEARLLLNKLMLDVIVSRDRVAASISSRALLEDAEIDCESDARLLLAVRTTTVAYGHEQRLRLDPLGRKSTPRDARLVELIARAFASRDELLGLTSKELEAMPVTQHRHLERIARLAYLAPQIVRAIIDGRQPRTLTARELARMGLLPLSWSEQLAMLGFGPA